SVWFFFCFQAEDCIRARNVTGVQTCALPISLDCAGAMFTASHNPAEYNGIKLCRSGARPVSQDTGLSDIIDMLVDGIPAYDGEEIGRASCREREQNSEAAEGRRTEQRDKWMR